MFSVRLSDVQRRALALWARAMGVTMSDVVRMLLDKELVAYLGTSEARDLQLEVVRVEAEVFPWR